MKIAVIPDTHFPYCDDKKIGQTRAGIRQFKPDVIIQVGDLLDQVSFSSFPRDPSKCVYLPRQ